MTPYLVAGAAGTLLYGINNAGYLVGDEIGLATGPTAGFITTPDGQVTTFQYSSSYGTYAFEINDGNVVTGYFNDANLIYHGFLRFPDGRMIQMDVPGAYGTLSFGLNDVGQIVGQYQDAHSDYQSFVYANGQYTKFNVSGALATYLSDINNVGQLLGAYVDSSGIYHGFIATPTAAN
jgi:uncharacterized membrane protein